jgi:ABC-type Fe3+/spermidine/putrescine transport system ATPase subunit
VLLLDEPFSSLEAKLREQLRIELKLLQAKLGITVLFVTHDQVEALSLSDRIAILHQGRIQQLGHPRDLYEQPTNTFVRDFLGKTVLLKGTVQAADNATSVAVTIHGAANSLIFDRSRLPETVCEGRVVTLALRPEDFTLSPTDSSQPSPCTIRGIVEAIVFVGERIEYLISVPEQGSILAYGKRHDVFQVGQEVALNVQSADISLWSPERD